MLSFTTASRPPVPEPRSGEDLILQPLDPQEDCEKERLRIRRLQRIAAGVTSLVVAVLAVFAAYRFPASAFSTKPRATTAALPTNDADQGVSIPQILDVPAGHVTPVPQPPKVSGAAKDNPRQTERERPQAPRVPTPVASGPPSPDDRVKERATGPETTPNKTAPRDKVDSPTTHVDAIPQRAPDRQVPKGNQPPAKPKDAATAIELREMKELIAQMKMLIGKGDFGRAANKAGDFRDRGLTATTLKSREYRELLKLQRSAIERYFTSQLNAGQSPQRTGDLEIAVIEHDLMHAYLNAEEPAVAREHFLNAERGYERAISVARQREKAEPAAAKRELQEIKDNLGQLYARWAECTRDKGILRRAEAAVRESEQLLDFAKDRSAAEQQLMEARARIKQTQELLP